jgi:predicted AAA+ superfamily ATPase
MFRRKIESTFLQWKSQKNHNPLIVKGCRQCGKTYSFCDFAKKNYKNVVYLNFFENPEYAQFFAESLEVDTIVIAT